MVSLDEALSSDPPCYPRACAIQACLQKNQFKEDKCQRQIDRLYECCNSFYQRQGEDAKTVCCPKPKLLRLHMKHREKQ